MAILLCHHVTSWFLGFPRISILSPVLARRGRRGGLVRVRRSLSYVARYLVPGPAGHTAALVRLTGIATVLKRGGATDGTGVELVRSSWTHLLLNEIEGNLESSKKTTTMYFNFIEYNYKTFMLTLAYQHPSH